MKYKQLKISVSQYNEVNPNEIQKLFDHGARLIKSKTSNGVYIGTFKQGDKEVKAYSDDDICIGNVVLPLSINEDYSFEIALIVPQK